MIIIWGLPLSLKKERSVVMKRTDKGIFETFFVDLPRKYMRWIIFTLIATITPAVLFNFLGLSYQLSLVVTVVYLIFFSLIFSMDNNDSSFLP